MQLDGSPLEACSIATLVALQCTRIPHCELTVGESGAYEDFDIVGDLSEGAPLDCCAVPICISVVKVRLEKLVDRLDVDDASAFTVSSALSWVLLLQVGDVFVVDATKEEQECASAAVSIAMDMSGSSCCGMDFTQSGVLPRSDIALCFMVPDHRFWACIYCVRKMVSHNFQLSQICYFNFVESESHRGGNPRTAANVFPIRCTKI